MAKKTSILIVILLLAVVFWVWADKWINVSGKFDGSGNWVMPLIALVLMSTSVALAFLLIEDNRIKNLIFIIVGTPAVAVFGFTPYFPGALALTFLFHLVAIRRVRTELEQRIKINIGVIMKQALPMIIMPIFIVVSFAYFLSPSVQQSANKKELPSSVRTLIVKTVDSVIGSQLSNLPPAEKEQTRNEVMKEIMQRVNDFVAPYSKFIPPILAFGLFLVLIGFNFIFVWLGVWLAMLTFSILKSTGFVKIIKREVEAETIQI